MEKQCIICGKIFKVIPALFNIRKSCSNYDCTCKTKSLAKIGEKNTNWKGGKNTKCLSCDNVFWVTPSHKKTRKCCSKKCTVVYWKNNNLRAGKNNSMFGKKHSIETKRKISEKRKLRLQNREWVEKELFNRRVTLKENYKQRGIKCSQDKERSKKLSIALKGHIISEETKRKISKANKGRTQTSESNFKRSLKLKGLKKPEGFGAKISKANKGKIISQETRNKISLKHKIRFSNPEYKQQFIEKQLQWLLKRPTSLEKKMMQIIDKHKLPYKYTGNGTFLIGYGNPDFININGEKIAIEVHNFYHHKNNYRENRSKQFAKFGWKTIFINEDEIKNENFVLKKLQGVD